MGQEQLMGQQFIQAQIQQQLGREQIEQSRLQQQRLTAEMPGVEAEAAMLKLKQKQREEVLDVVPKFVSPDGTSFNDRGAFLELLKRGQLESAIDLSKEVENVEALRLANASRSQNMAGILNETLEKASGRVASILVNAPPQDRMTILKKLTDQLDQTYKSTGIPVGSSVYKAFVTADPKTGQINVDSSKMNAQFQSTINAEARARLDMDLQKEFLDPASRDPNNPRNVEWRRWIELNSPGGPGVPSSFTIADVKNNPSMLPTLQTFLRNEALPPELRANAKKAAAEYESLEKKFDSAIDLWSKVPEQAIPTRIGTKGSKIFQENIRQNPDLAAAVAALDAYNTMFPKDAIDYSNLSGPEIRAKLNVARENIRGHKRVEQDIEQQTTFRKPQEATNKARLSKSDVATIRTEFGKNIESKDLRSAEDAFRELQYLASKDKKIDLTKEANALEKLRSDLRKEAAKPSEKPVATMEDIKEYARRNRKSIEQAKRDAEAAGYTVK